MVDERLRFGRSGAHSLRPCDHCLSCLCPYRPQPASSAASQAPAPMAGGVRGNSLCNSLNSDRAAAASHMRPLNQQPTSNNARPIWASLQPDNNVKCDMSNRVTSFALVRLLQGPGLIRCNPRSRPIVLPGGVLLVRPAFAAENQSQAECIQVGSIFLFLCCHCN